MKTIYDPFAELAKPFAVVTIHNVLLVDVQPGEGGFAKLSVEYNEEFYEVQSGGRWDEKWSRQDIERHGYLVPARPHAGADIPQGACYFRAYTDPSLRRVPELDGALGGQAWVGWRCDAKPGGFTAPAGLIPGENGRFVPDETVEVTLRVPPEFVRQCRRVQRTPLELLRGFVGDAAGIQNYVSNPRADGYGSNGSDERDMAEAWINRAYGMDAIDVFAAEERDHEEACRQDDRDDIASLLDDFVANGGEAADLIKAVQKLVDQQGEGVKGP
ncbi:hypothetical protein ACVNIS_24970 (plasmid) [Sphaerotilaceae bacterium SBD11-9]